MQTQLLLGEPPRVNYLPDPIFVPEDFAIWMRERLVYQLALLAHEVVGHVQVLADLVHVLVLEGLQLRELLHGQSLKHVRVYSSVVLEGAYVEEFALDYLL